MLNCLVYAVCTGDMATWELHAEWQSEGWSVCCYFSVLVLVTYKRCFRQHNLIDYYLFITIALVILVAIKLVNRFDKCFRDRPMAHIETFLFPQILVC